MCEALRIIACEILLCNVDGYYCKTTKSTDLWEFSVGSGNSVAGPSLQGGGGVDRGIEVLERDSSRRNLQGTDALVSQLFEQMSQLRGKAIQPIVIRSLDEDNRLFPVILTGRYRRHWHAGMLASASMG